jgi:hypothetical protein
MTIRSRNIRSHIRAAVAAGAISLLVFGCGSSHPSNSPSPTRSSATPALTEASTPTRAVPTTPPATPTAAPTPTPEPSAFVDHGDGDITWGDIAVAQIPGLKAELKDGKAIYVDAKGVYAGEFKPNLDMQQADGTERQTGVAVLIGDIVSTMTKKAHDAGGFELAIPIDLRGIDNEEVTSVSSDTVTIEDIALPEVVVHLAAEATLVEFNPYNKGLAVVVEHQTLVNYEIGDYSTLGSSSSIPNGQRLTFTHLLTFGSDASNLSVAQNLNLDKTVAVGFAIAKVSAGTVRIGCYTAALTTDWIDVTNILTTGGVPIAIAQN